MRLELGLAGTRIEVPAPIGTRVGNALRTLNTWLFNPDAWLGYTEGLAVKAQGGVQLPANAKPTDLARLDRHAFQAGDRAVVTELVPLLKLLPDDIYDDAAALMIAFDQMDKEAAVQTYQAAQVAAARKAGKPIPVFPQRHWSWGTDPSRLMTTVSEIMNGVAPARLPALLTEMETRLGPEIFSRVDPAAIQRLTQGVGQQRFDRIMRVLNGFYEHRNNLLEMERRTGVISQDEYDLFTQEFPHYAPIRVQKYMDTKQQKAPPRGNISLRDNLLRHLTAEGTESAQLDPFMAYAGLTRQAYKMVARNRLATSVADLAAIPGMNRLVWTVPNEYTPVNGQVTFTRLENGEMKTYAVHKDIRRMADWDPIMLSKEIDAIGRAMTTPLRWGATGANIRFLGPNALGDLGDAIVKAGVSPQDYARAVKDIWGDQALLRVYETSGGAMGGAGMHGGQEAVGASKAWQRQVVRADTKQQLLDVIRDLVTLHPVQEVGGRVEAGPRVATFLKNLTDEQVARIKFDERVRRQNLAVIGEDDAVKRAALQQNFQNSLTPQEQTWLAAGRLSPLDVPVKATVGGLTVTMDFLTGGTIVMFANRFINFFNVGFQAPAQVVRSFTAQSGKRGAAVRLAMYVAVPVVLSEVWNSLFPEQEDVPQYEQNRSMRLALPSPGKDRFGNAIPASIEIPLRGWAPVGMAIRESLRASRRADPEGWGKLVASVMEAVAPGTWQKQAAQTEWGWAHSQGPTGWEGAGSVLQSWSPVQGQSGADVLMGLLPAGAVSVIEALINWDFYRNRPLVAEDRKYLPPADQYGPSTTGAAIALGKYFSWSPAKIEHLVKGSIGGVGAQALDAATLAMQAGGVINRGYMAPQAGDTIYGWWVPKEGQPELRKADDIPELRAQAKGGVGTLYVVAAKDEKSAQDKVFKQQFVDSTGKDVPITSTFLIGGLLGTVYKTQGGQMNRTVVNAQQQAMGEYTVEHTRRAWQTLRPVLDEALAEQAKLDADLQSGRKSVDEWKQGYRVIAERKQGAMKEAVQAFPQAAIMDDRLAQYKTIAERVRMSAPTDQDRIEMLTTAYLSMDAPEKTDGSGEPDLDAFFAARKDFLAAMPPSDRDALLVQVRKNSTPLRQEYNTAQDLMQQYYDLPRYKGTSYARGEEIYAAGQKLRALEAQQPAAVRNRTEVALGQLRAQDPIAADAAREYLLARTQDSPRAAFWKEHQAELDKWFGSGTDIKGTTGAPGVTAGATKATAVTTAPTAPVTTGAGSTADTQYYQERNDLERRIDAYYDAGNERTQEILDTYNPLSTAERTAWRKAHPADYQQMQAYYKNRDALLEKPENAKLARYLLFLDDMGGRDTRQVIENVTGKSTVDIFVRGMLGGDIKLEAPRTVQVEAKAATPGVAPRGYASTTATTPARVSTPPRNYTSTAQRAPASSKTPAKAPAKKTTAKKPAPKATAQAQQTGETRWDWMVRTGQAREFRPGRGFAPAATPAQPTRTPTPIRTPAVRSATVTPPLEQEEGETRWDWLLATGQAQDDEGRRWSADFRARYGRAPAAPEWQAHYYTRRGLDLGQMLARASR